MEKLDGSGRITITDEGRGFDAKTVLSDPQAMHGLMILRDRLNLMGGTIEIESVPGNGTRARIEFPVEKLAA
jgi:signal transduction histidine kinase